MITWLFEDVVFFLEKKNTSVFFSTSVGQISQSWFPESRFPLKGLVFVGDVDPDSGPENLSQFSVGTRLPANELIQVLFDTGIIKLPILGKSSNANVW